MLSYDRHLWAMGVILHLVMLGSLTREKLYHNFFLLMLTDNQYGTPIARFIDEEFDAAFLGLLGKCIQKHPSEMLFLEPNHVDFAFLRDLVSNPDTMRRIRETLEPVSEDALVSFLKRFQGLSHEGIKELYGKPEFLDMTLREISALR